jgi:hypothetical protein
MAEGVLDLNCCSFQFEGEAVNRTGPRPPYA